MLAAARGSGVASVANGDVVALPFAKDSFDAVMANHMLYHVADIELAVREARRVLVEGGTFLAVANATAHLAELDALLAEVSGRDGWWRPSQRFTTDNGRPFLDDVFGSVELVMFRGALHVPDARPVMAFAHSMRELSGAEYTDEVWEQLMSDFESAVRGVVQRDGEFVTRTDTGVFVCR
jgi:SAM-dependent methyltransferase